jgi:hypothetical protein
MKERFVTHILCMVLTGDDVTYGLYASFDNCRIDRLTGSNWGITKRKSALQTDADRPIYPFTNT